MKKRVIYFITFTLITYGLSFAASENLNEIFNRKSRAPYSSWGKEYLENVNEGYVWQPETLNYSDNTTNTEVWRMTSTKGIYNSLPDISFSQWSADGKRFAYGSRRQTNSFNDNGWALERGINIVLNTDGSFLRPLPNAPSRSVVHREYFHWSPSIPDVYYEFGSNYSLENLQTDILYKVTVSDKSLLKIPIIDFKQNGSEMRLKKAIASDGTAILAEGNGKNFFATIYPNSQIRVHTPNGWNQKVELDNYWGNTPSIQQWATYPYHDQFFRGTQKTGLWFHILPEGFYGWWRIAPYGSNIDGGPVHIPDHEYPYSWGGEIEPLNTTQGANTYNSCDPNYKDAWCCDNNQITECSGYWSHPGFDRWGTKVSFTNSTMVKGAGVYDFKNHKFDKLSIDRPHYDWHQDWSSFSDYFVSSPSGSFEISNFIYTSKIDGSVNLKSVNSHARESGSTSYQSLPRATQSPDGTKIMWHSDFLNSGPEQIDIFWSVAYYPHPPEIFEISQSGENIIIKFDWRLNTQNPRGYTGRGWPNEDLDMPPPPRETKLFRLWKSKDNITWLPVRTVNSDIFEKFDFVNGGFKSGAVQYWEFQDNPGQGIWYYGITSLEHSGLESRTLSNIWQVSIDQNSTMTTSFQSEGYPDNPKGIKKFYNNQPAAPGGLTVTRGQRPGHFMLRWIEPGQPLIRYYNIYYSNMGSPQAEQKYRIASIPVGHNRWLDWCADTTKDGLYTITSVDTQGNEGLISTISAPKNVRLAN